MIVVMKKDANGQDVSRLVERVESLGLKAHVIVGTERTVVAVVGDDRKTYKDSLESSPGVAEVVPILAPYKVASLEVKSEPTVVRAGSLTVGGGTIGVIAGPCSVESEAQIMASAKAVKAAGATALRGGAFKPRTSPYSFQGLKEDGLKMLATARAETGLAVVTEVVATEDVELVAKYADVLQVGAEHAKLPPARGGRGGRSAGAAQTRAERHGRRIAAGGRIHFECRQPERNALRAGDSHLRVHTRFTLPLATVVYLHAKTHLPVVVDPSHGTGHTYLVPQMAVASVAAGADGLILEVHPAPEKALSDGYQSLTFQQFEETMTQCRKVATALGRKM